LSMERVKARKNACHMKIAYTDRRSIQTRPLLKLYLSKFYHINRKDWTVRGSYLTFKILSLFPTLKLLSKWEFTMESVDDDSSEA